MSVSWNILAGCVRTKIVFAENSFTTEDAEDTEFLFQPYQLRLVLHRKSLERKNSVRLCVLCVLCGETNTFIMAKDRLITPSYCFILAANFLLYFGFWLLIPVLPFYLSEFFQVRDRLSLHRTFLLYSSGTLHSSVFRLSAWYICTQTAVSFRLFYLYDDVRRLSDLPVSLTLFIIFRIIHGVSFGDGLQWAEIQSLSILCPLHAEAKV